MTHSRTSASLGACAALAVVLAAGFPAAAEPLYPSSVVGTEFDFILETDPDTFERLEFQGRGTPEMPDKTTDNAPLLQPGFEFMSHYSDGTRVHIAIDADFGTEEAARAEALRYTPRLGKLPTVLRRGVERLVVHVGGPDTTAFSDVGLIVVYSANATKRIGTHDLEETIFHESVHATWDAMHATSRGWRAAQESDRRFVTRYAERKPEGEDLAESALFAYTLLHHLDRIPVEEAQKILQWIPARIAYVAKLVRPDEPIHIPIDGETRGDEDKKDEADTQCTIDLSVAAQLSDVLSNALLRGFEIEEAPVRTFLTRTQIRKLDSDGLLAATASHFHIEFETLRAAADRFRHCNCRHGDLDD